MAKRGRKLIDHTGQTFYRLHVLAPAEHQKGGATMWRCKCDCGREVIVRGSNLRSGNSKSCGECGRVYTPKRLPTEQEEVTRALTFGAQRRQTLDCIEALDDRAERIRVAAYPDFMANESIATAISNLRAFLETAYRDFLWDDFERSTQNCARADACIRELENLMGDGGTQQREMSLDHHGESVP